jgi:hypothetical protein
MIQVYRGQVAFSVTMYFLNDMSSPKYQIRLVSLAIMGRVTKTLVFPRALSSWKSVITSYDGPVSKLLLLRLLKLQPDH